MTHPRWRPSTIRRRAAPAPMALRRYTMGTLLGMVNGQAYVQLDSGERTKATLPRHFFYLPDGARVAMYPYPGGEIVIVGWMRFPPQGQERT